MIDPPAASPTRRAWRLRGTLATDRSAIEAHLNECWHATYDSLVGADAVAHMVRDMRCAQDLNAFLCGEGARLTVAVNEAANIVGTIAIGISLSAGLSFITSMYVAPSTQRQGVGRALIGVALDQALAGRPVALSVLALRPDVVGFYRTFGFEPRGHSSYQVGAVACETIEMVRPAGYR
jgi:GNAT superfamily N-acetyltransferase